MTAAFIFFVIWSTIGLLTAAVLARRGHNFWLFAPIGLAYGPLTAVIGWAAQRNRSTAPSVLIEGGTWHDDGLFDVLIGVDGTERSIDAAAEVIELFGPVIRTVHLASVIDYEISDSMDSFRTDDDRIAHLEHAARRLGVPNAELALLNGEPDVALAHHAETSGVDLIVVGHRTRPVARRLHGSTLSALARHGGTPVLVMPGA